MKVKLPLILILTGVLHFEVLFAQSQDDYRNTLQLYAGPATTYCFIDHSGSGFDTYSYGNKSQTIFKAGYQAGILLGYNTRHQQRSRKNFFHISTGLALQDLRFAQINDGAFTFWSGGSTQYATLVRNDYSWYYAYLPLKLEWHKVLPKWIISPFLQLGTGVLIYESSYSYYSLDNKQAVGSNYEQEYSNIPYDIRVKDVPFYNTVMAGVGFSYPIQQDWTLTAEPYLQASAYVGTYDWQYNYSAGILFSISRQYHKRSL